MKHYHPPFAHYRSIAPGHANALGLTPLGKAAIDEMTRLGMIIDVDHMSEKARRDVYAAVGSRGIPVAMGHSWYRDLGYTRAETSDPLKLRNETMKTADELSLVRDLGGPVAPITNQGDVRRVDGSGVTTECPGASTSWLQAYVYAVERMGDAGVGLGTDFNGLAEEPGPRFGPWACIARAKHDGGDDTLRRYPSRSMAASIRADADAQDAGVTYATPIRDAGKHRFHGPLRDPPYSEEERAVWIGIALWKAGASADADKQLTPLEHSIATSIAAGLGDTVQANQDYWRRAAFYLKSGTAPPAAPADVSGRYRRMLPIWNAWQRMESGNAGAPIERDIAGNRDFDVNLDGLAHYGLLPDFLQDVANQLRRGDGSVKDLSELFRSADTYVRAWERVENAARSMGEGCH